MMVNSENFYDVVCVVKSILDENNPLRFKMHKMKRANVKALLRNAVGNYFAIDRKNYDEEKMGYALKDLQLAVNIIKNSGIEI